MADLVQYYGTGRRKTSVARVYLRPGSGEYKVNGRPFNEYFVTEAQRSSARQPLLSTDTASSFNVVANVSGGGVNGQADAMKLGIARALMLQCGIAQEAEDRRHGHPRFTRQGTQEVRTEGRSQAVPVQQALGKFRVAGFEFRASAKMET